MLCNFLVCLGVWMAAPTRSDGAKIAMIFWALPAFVGSGFENVVANMTYYSLGMFEHVRTRSPPNSPATSCWWASATSSAAACSAYCGLRLRGPGQAEEARRRTRRHRNAGNGLPVCLSAGRGRLDWFRGCAAGRWWRDPRCRPGHGGCAGYRRWRAGVQRRGRQRR
ncbi:formate/nitrite transporter family protein [Streptomyces sp. NPDC005065]|uniref:formate/nitrite transporter family protein n=1 Tax=Streptomyces sp. NPDC005065 TaxID=3154461 RepID=UPI0033A4E377